jgi:hypothetical protein
MFAAALILKSAMPFLASASAERQGKALAEICTVYGVSLDAHAAHRHPPSHERGDASHGSDHCALAALAVLAMSTPPAAAAPPQVSNDTIATPAPRPSHVLDACARWVARLRHGPPRLA